MESIRKICLIKKINRIILLDFYWKITSGIVVFLCAICLIIRLKLNWIFHMNTQLSRILNCLCGFCSYIIKNKRTTLSKISRIAQELKPLRRGMFLPKRLNTVYILMPTFFQTIAQGLRILNTRNKTTKRQIIFLF